LWVVFGVGRAAAIFPSAVVSRIMAAVRVRCRRRRCPSRINHHFSNPTFAVELSSFVFILLHDTLSFKYFVDIANSLLVFAPFSQVFQSSGFSNVVPRGKTAAARIARASPRHPRLDVGKEIRKGGRKLLLRSGNNLIHHLQVWTLTYQKVHPSTASLFSATTTHSYRKLSNTPPRHS
jgi:hypothetical protein